MVLSVLAAAVTAFLAFRKSTDEAADALKKEREEAEAFNKQVSESAGKAISTYKVFKTNTRNASQPMKSVSG